MKVLISHTYVMFIFPVERQCEKDSITDPERFGISFPNRTVCVRLGNEIPNRSGSTPYFKSVWLLIYLTQGLNDHYVFFTNSVPQDAYKVLQAEGCGYR